MPTDPSDPLSTQNMKDRYYGTNDPVADKMLKQVTCPLCVYLDLCSNPVLTQGHVL